MATVAETLEMAASLIEPEGAWTQQVAGKPFPRSTGTPCCMGYAIEQNADGDMGPAIEALYAVAPFNSIRGLVAWNDAPERTQAEVVAALRAAAAKAREVRS